MTVTLINPRAALSVIRSDGGLRVNTGGPGLRGLPGAAGAAGGWAGTEADVMAAWGDRVPVKTSGGLMRLAKTEDLLPSAFFNALPDGGRFAGTPEPNTTAAAAFVAPGYLAAYNATTFLQGPKFITNNTTHGGSAGVLNGDVDNLVKAMRDTVDDAKLRYGPEFFLLDAYQGAGTLSSLVAGGVTHYLSYTNPSFALPRAYMASFWVKAAIGSIALPVNSWVNGVKLTAATAYAGAAGWLCVTNHWLDAIALNGYRTTLWPLYMTPGSVARIAAPVLHYGHAFKGQKLGLIPSIGSAR